VSWVDEMKRDAARVAFPNYMLKLDDEVTLEVTFERGYGDADSSTYEPDTTEIWVYINKGQDDQQSTWYSNDSAADFIHTLMTVGDERG
jgi:hypothetical protein